MSLEEAILGFLGEKPRSGYDLKTRCFGDKAKPFWTADQAQIYRTLERLQAARLVTSKRTRQMGKPDRRVFALTTAGRESLGSWTAENLALPVPRDPFLLQLYFGAGLSDTDLLEHLRARRQLHQSRLEELRERAVVAAADASTPLRQAALRDVAFDGAIATERAAVDWIDDALDTISSGLLPGADDVGAGSQRHLFGTGSA